MISWQTAAHWPYVEAPFPFYLVFYDRGAERHGGRRLASVRAEIHFNITSQREVPEIFV